MIARTWETRGMIVNYILIATIIPRFRHSDGDSGGIPIVVYNSNINIMTANGRRFTVFSRGRALLIETRSRANVYTRMGGHCVLSFRLQPWEKFGVFPGVGLHNIFCIMGDIITILLLLCTARLVGVPSAEELRGGAWLGRWVIQQSVRWARNSPRKISVKTRTANRRKRTVVHSSSDRYKTRRAITSVRPHPPRQQSGGCCCLHRTTPSSWRGARAVHRQSCTQYYTFDRHGRRWR